jgi:phosphoribosylformylglycinamidine synthase
MLAVEMKAKKKPRQKMKPAPQKKPAKNKTKLEKPKHAAPKKQMKKPQMNAKRKTIKTKPKMKKPVQMKKSKSLQSKIPAKSELKKTKPKIPAKTKTKKSKPIPQNRPMAQTKEKVIQMKAQMPSKPQAGEQKPKVLVLAGFGLNSEAELAHAFGLAGAEASIVHFSDISSGKKKLEGYQIFAIPGGWAFGDDIAGGKVLANKLKTTFRQQFEQFVSSGKPIIGVCNGFQVLVKLGALPNIGLSFSQEATLERNASGKFEDRWVFLKPQKSVCKYFEGVPFINCPVRHGEGRFIAKDEAALRELEKKGLAVVKYSDDKLSDDAPYPQNPNGSPRGIAGICDPTGKIFGLMPHPECSVRKHTFPRWTAGISHEKNSLRLFENIVKEGKKYV